MNKNSLRSTIVRAASALLSMVALYGASVPFASAQCVATSGPGQQCATGKNYCNALGVSSCFAPITCSGEKNTWNCSTCNAQGFFCSCPGSAPNDCTGSNGNGKCQANNLTCSTLNRVELCDTAGGSATRACGGCLPGYYNCTEDVGYDCRIGTTPDACFTPVHLNPNGAQTGRIAVTGDVNIGGNLDTKGMTMLDTRSLTFSGTNNLLYGVVKAGTTNGNLMLLENGTSNPRFKVSPQGDVSLVNGGTLNICFFGGFCTGFKAPDGLTQNIIWNLPNKDGNATDGYYLKSDGSKNLSWGNPTTAAATLQTTYDSDVDGSGTSITTTSADGALIVAGTQNFEVTTAGKSIFDTTTLVVDSLNNRVGVGIDPGTSTTPFTVLGGGDLTGTGTGGVAKLQVCTTASCNYMLIDDNEIQTYNAVTNVPGTLALQKDGGKVDINGNLSVGAITAPLFLYGAGLDGSTNQKTGIYSDTTEGLLFDVAKDSLGNKLDVHFNWRGGGTDALMIDGPTGKVGVNMNQPTGNLHVITATSGSATNNRGAIVVGDTTDGPNLAIDSTRVQARNATSGTNAASTLRLNPGGGAVGTGFYPTYFTESWSNSATATSSEISNDRGTYKTLMIVGNKSGDGVTRSVSIWDKLTVNGTLHTTGSTYINGDLSAQGNLSTTGGAWINGDLSAERITGTNGIAVWGSSASFEGGGDVGLASSSGMVIVGGFQSPKSVGIDDNEIQARINYDEPGTLTLNAGGGGTIVGDYLSVLDTTYVTTGTAGSSSEYYLRFRINGLAGSYISVGSVRRNGQAQSVLYNTTSDARVKENLRAFTGALDTMVRLKVHRYDYIGTGSDRSDIGFLAQELYELYPEAVTVGGADPLTDPWSVDYGRLTPLLTGAMQELNAKVEEQEKLIESLEARLKALEESR